MEKNAVLTMMPKDAGALDIEIMKHIARELKVLVTDGMCDLSEYGTGDEYDVSVILKFEKVEVE